ncbi:MAG: hypothetical protein GH143_06560 [Calditrichaeota bacterium]|nr:hypothetical protein [Calditrichota bacterium]
MQTWQIEYFREEEAKDGILYKLRGNSDYFREKYGTSNPHYMISGEDIEAWEGGWRASNTPGCTIYGWRNGVELLPTEGKVYYGHVICGPITPDSHPILLGEVVHESELEPVEWESLVPASSEGITFESLDPGLFR